MFRGNVQFRQIQYGDVIRGSHIFHFHPVDNHTYGRGIIRNRIDQDKRTARFILFIRIEEKLLGSSQDNAGDLIELQWQIVLCQLSIVNGKMLTGANGAGGEIGHIHVEDDEQETCGCGNRGCLEQYSSATGVTRLAKRKLEKTTQDSVLRTTTLSAKSVFDAVKAKDPVAMEIAEQFGQYLGEGLAAIACVTNPEAFVIGGGVSKAGSVLIDYIRPYYQKAVFHADRDVKFELATLGNDAGIYGAAKLVLDR